MLDLRLADDILIFGKSSLEIGRALDQLVSAFAAVGLVLNASKTVVLTTEAQPPKSLVTPCGISLKVVDNLVGHKWLGCMLTTRQSCNHSVDASFHVQSARRSFFANRWIPCDRNVRVNDSSNFFDKVVSSVACFAAAQRTIYQHDLNMLDVSFSQTNTSNRTSSWWLGLESAISPNFTCMARKAAKCH